MPVLVHLCPKPLTGQYKQKASTNKTTQACGIGGVGDTTKKNWNKNVKPLAGVAHPDPRGEAQPPAAHRSRRTSRCTTLCRPKPPDPGSRIARVPAGTEGLARICAEETPLQKRTWPEPAQRGPTSGREAALRDRHSLAVEAPPLPQRVRPSLRRADKVAGGGAAAEGRPAGCVEPGVRRPSHAGKQGAGQTLRGRPIGRGWGLGEGGEAPTHGSPRAPPRPSAAAPPHPCGVPVPS